MSKRTNPRSVFSVFAGLMMVGAIWIGPAVGAVEAKGGPPGGLDVNVVDSVELGVAVTDSALTHLGQHIQDHVTLVDRYNEDASCHDRMLVRMSPDGTKSAEEFQIPAGRNLVITDVTWRTSGRTVSDTPLIVGETLFLVVSVGNTPAISTAETIDTASGKPGASVHLVSGVVVGPGAVICPSAAEIRPSGGIVVNLEHIVINGYLIDASP